MEPRRQRREAAPKIEGINKEVCKTDHLVFQALKFDILTIILPLNKIMQVRNLLTTEFFTVWSDKIENIWKVQVLQERI